MLPLLAPNLRMKILTELSFSWVLTRLGLILFGALLAGLIAELSFRAYVSLVRPLFPVYVNSSQFPPHARGVYRGGMVSTDTFGFRNKDELWSAPKKGLIVGDSVCFGMGLNDEDSLSAKLNELSGATGIKVLNMCQPGWDTPDLRDRLFRYGDSVNDWEFLIWHYFINDAKNSLHYAPYSESESRPRRVSELSELLNFGFLRYIDYLQRERIKMDPRRGTASSYYRWCLDSFEPTSLAVKTEERYLKDVVFWAKSRGIPLFLVISPSRQQFKDGMRSPQEFVLRFSEEHGISAVNLIEEVPEDIFLPGDDAHYSANGSELVAKVLFDRIVSRYSELTLASSSEEVS